MKYCNFWGSSTINHKQMWSCADEIRENRDLPWDGQCPYSTTNWCPVRKGIEEKLVACGSLVDRMEKNIKKAWKNMEVIDSPEKLEKHLEKEFR